MRTVTIKQLYKSLSKELGDLPFQITKGGVPIAVVLGLDQKVNEIEAWVPPPKKLNGKDYIKELKKECVVCGYNKYKGALDFHHIDTKGKTISHLRSKKAVDKELKENPAVVLCSNCHREVHAGIICIDSLDQEPKSKKKSRPEKKINATAGFTQSEDEFFKPMPKKGKK